MPDNTILQSGSPIEDKKKLSEDLDPGELVELGGSNDIQAHSEAGGFAQRWFLREQTENLGAGIDDTVASGDTGTVLRCSGGEKLQARLGTGGTEVNISKGDELESAGDGTLQAFGTATPSEDVVAVAAEAVDNSSASSESFIEIYVA